MITQGDSTSYLEPARNLFLHGAYSNQGLLELDRTPGYPIFTALTGAAFGNILLTASVQITLAALTLLIIRKTAILSFSSERAGYIAAWLFALEPLSIASTIRIMPETLFVLLLVLVIERLLTFRTTSRLTTLCIAGLSLAAATYVRPVSYYLVLPLAIALVVACRKQRKLRWQAPAVLLVSTIPLIAAWQVRNQMEAGYGGFSSIVERNLYFYQSAEVAAELQKTSLAVEQENLGYTDEQSYLACHPDQRSWTPAQRLRYMRTAALAIIAQHRWLYARTHLAGIAVVAFTPGSTEFLQLLNLYPSPESMPRRILNEGIFRSTDRVFHQHFVAAFWMFYFEGFLLGLYIFAAMGLRVGKGSTFANMTLVGIALYFLLISGGAQAVGRYRLPVVPELCILAAGSLSSFRTKQERGLEDPAHRVAIPAA